MGYYINKEDFVGKIAINHGMYSDFDIEDYIQRYELKYLKELMGIDLYDLYKANADLDPVNHIPTDPFYLKIFNPLEFNYSFNVYISEGFKQMLLNFVYFEYMKDQVSNASMLGEVKQQNELSKSAISMIYFRYNEGVKTFNNIVRYMVLNPEGYEKALIRMKQTAYWI